MKRYIHLLPGDLKFFVDESTGQYVVNRLCADGYNVFSVMETFRGMSDRDIIHHALMEDRIIITNDKDFGELIYRKGLPARGVILLRLQDERSANKIRVIRETLKTWQNEITGHFIVAGDYKIRKRPLPRI